MVDQLKAGSARRRELAARLDLDATAWTPSSSNEICVIAISIIIAHEFVLRRIRVASSIGSIIVGVTGPLIIVIVDRHVLGDERLRFVAPCGRAVGTEQVFKPLEQEFDTGNTGSRRSACS